MTDDVTFHYDPTRKGLGQILGELEKDVMEILWSRGELSVREIMERLRPGEIAYSTVITVANRLAKKRLLARTKRGKTFYYRPRIERMELVELATRRILRKVSDIAPPATVVQLMDSIIGDDPEVLKALERLIEKKRKDRPR